jgi:enoyl-CoA hydratase/3-hydroxyacyl-CoA dehydrogenase
MPALRAQVQIGNLGKKTGRGFYAWQGSRMTTTLTPEMGAAFDPALVLSVVANEASKLVEQGVATPAEIDLAMRHGCAFPQGPLEWADEVGLDVVAKHLATLEEKGGHAIAEPYEMLVEMVQARKLGKKSGRGFYEHAAQAAGAPKYETVLVAVDEAARIGTITVNRPHRLNAINGQLIVDLRKALAEMEDDARVRVVVLTGAGDKAFCAGADLTDVSATTPAQIAELARQGHRMCIDMEKLGKPVIAAINGLALGGGLELALPADFRVAARRAKMGLPEVTLGLLPAMGGTQRLPRLVGLSAAKEIAMLGERMDAEQAKALGLVHRVFDNETFEADVKAFAIEVASRAPLSLKFTKQLLNAAATTDILVGLEMEAAAFGVLASTEDVAEGVTSMFAKKKPEFQGK